MTNISALLLGLGLGLRHAADADHVVVLSTLLERERGPARAARIALFWGAGHATTLLVAGALVLLTGLRPPPSWETAVELLVAIMLMAVGARQLARPFSETRGVKRQQVPGSLTRPVLIGMVHGLAGSAGLTLLAMTTMRSSLWALVYLLLVGLGTILGMVMTTLIISSTLRWVPRPNALASSAWAVLPGALSALVGATLLYDLLTR